MKVKSISLDASNSVFHFSVLKSFVGAFNRNSWRLVKRLQSEIGSEFDVHDYMSEVTVDILLGIFSARNYLKKQQSILNG